VAVAAAATATAAAARAEAAASAATASISEIIARELGILRGEVINLARTSSGAQGAAAEHSELMRAISDRAALGARLTGALEGEKRAIEAADRAHTAARLEAVSAASEKARATSLENERARLAAALQIANGELEATRAELARYCQELADLREAADEMAKRVAGGRKG
jgi:chromosome segregation ATPase